MKALIVATGSAESLGVLSGRYHSALVPFFGRPFLQHTIEYLAEQNVARFELILHHDAEKVRHLIGDGRRWGCQARFHQVDDPRKPFACLNDVDLSDSPTVLLGDASRLPVIDLERLLTNRSADRPLALCWRKHTGGRGAKKLRWAGWVLLPRRFIERLPADLDVAELGQYIIHLAQARGHIIDAGEPLRTTSPDAILRSHRRVLDSNIPTAAPLGLRPKDGTWRGRNVTLHATARIRPPVFLGDNTRIGKNASIGPYAIVGPDCVIDHDATVSTSVTFPNTYVGPSVQLRDTVVDRNHLVDVSRGTILKIEDSTVLAGLGGTDLRQAYGRFIGQIQRSAAQLLLAPWVRVPASRTDRSR